MKQIRRTEVVKAAVEFQGEVRNTGGEVKLRPGGGRKGVGPPPRKVSVQDMIDQIRAKFTISDEEAPLHPAGHGGEGRRPGNPQHGAGTP